MSTGVRRKEFQTASPILKWYLRLFRRYSVFYCTRTPILMAMGVVIYRTTWILVQA